MNRNGNWKPHVLFYRRTKDKWKSIIAAVMISICENKKKIKCFHLILISTLSWLTKRGFQFKEVNYPKDFREKKRFLFFEQNAIRWWIIITINTLKTIENHSKYTWTCWSNLAWGVEKTIIYYWSPYVLISEMFDLFSRWFTTSVFFFFFNFRVGFLTKRNVTCTTFHTQNEFYQRRNFRKRLVSHATICFKH